MAAKRDYYEVLGVDRSAGERDIARAYRQIAIKYHPDSNPGDEAATARFKEGAEAYEVLSDSEKRAKYDRFGHSAFEGASHYSNPEDIFEVFGDLFGGGGIFGDMFGGGRRSRRVRQGADIKCEVILDLEEAAAGITQTVQFNRSEVCKTCDGSGSRPGSKPKECARCGGQGQVIQRAGILRVQTTCPSCHGAGAVITDPCADCRGRGNISKKVTLDVVIPPGVDDGMRVRVTGEGEPSIDGGPPGDCYCFIRVNEHVLFRREGKHLIVEAPITYTQAVLGATIETPTLNGPVELTVPAGTESGHVFQMRGLGIADPHGGPPGDLLVRTTIEIPMKVSDSHEAVLRELAEQEQANVTPHRKSFLDAVKGYFSHSESDS